jgi:drug/metabolite transporter (DMT)-like permease
MAVQRRMGGAEWGYLLALSAAWGGIFLFNRLALTDFPPFTAVLLRLSLAAPLLLALVHAQGDSMPRSPKLWAQFFVMGILNNALPFTLFVWGQQTISSGLASIINALTPVATALVCHAMTSDEKLTRAKSAGVLLGLAGVIALIGPGALAGIGRDVVAELVLLLAPVSYAFAGLWGRQFHTLPPAVPAAGMVSCSALTMLPVALLHDHPWMLTPGLTAWSAVIAQAVIGTAIAYWLYFRILKTAGATNLLLVTILMPPMALMLGAIVLGERFPWSAFLGLGLIFLGLAAIDGRALPWIAKRARGPGATTPLA